MNNKGQLGSLLIVFVGILTALVLYQGINPFIGDATGANVGLNANQSITMPATGSTVDLVGQELITTFGVYNSSSGQLVPATNYSLAEGVGSDGLKGVRLTSLGGNFTNAPVNVSYSYYPDGYIDNAGGRSISLLIPLLAALAIVAFAIPSLREWIMER